VTGSSSAGGATAASTGAAAGYRPERTLRLGVELRRQFKRRRTIGVLVLMAVLPLRPRPTAGSTWSTSPPPAG
jgi:ABC-2 type transport system permease protein